jgi:hypothetical protein
MRTLWRIYRAAKRLHKVGVPRYMAWSLAQDYVRQIPGAERWYTLAFIAHRLHQRVKATPYRGERVTFENIHLYPYSVQGN